MSKPFSRVMALLASVASLGTLDRNKALEAYKSRGKGREGKPAPNLFKARRGCVYPERSTRQENWSFRRAQGGPGLTPANTPRP